MAILANPNPIFQRAMRIISSITQEFPAVVTTTFAHQYKDGMIVRLNIPLGWGMQEANQKQGTIKVLSSTTFSIDIDTTSFDAFVVSMTFPYSYQYPQSIPVGEISATLSSATQNVLPIN